MIDQAIEEINAEMQKDPSNRYMEIIRKTLRKYAQELERIKRKQEKMMPALKAIGEKILHGERGGQDA